MDSMLEKLQDLVESWEDSFQEQGKASDGQRMKAIIASRPMYKRHKKRDEKYLVKWEGKPLHRASWVMDKDLRLRQGEVRAYVSMLYVEGGTKLDGGECHDPPHYHAT